MSDTLFTFRSLEQIQQSDPAHAAKVAYVKAADLAATAQPEPAPEQTPAHAEAVAQFLETGRRATPKGRKPTDQLLSPVERIMLAHLAIEEESAALLAILESPVMLPAHKARALRAVQQIAAARLEAASFFDLVKERCRFKEQYDRKKVTQ